MDNSSALYDHFLKCLQGSGALAIIVKYDTSLLHTSQTFELLTRLDSAHRTKAINTRFDQT